MRSFHLLRLLSTALTVPTILLTFGICALAVPEAPSMAAVAAIVAALLPSHVAIGPMLNNDALSDLFIVGTTYLIVVAVTTGDATALTRAALVALAGTTVKLSGLYLPGLVALTLLLRRDLLPRLLRDPRVRAWLAAAAAAAVVPALVLIHNLVEWGDPFAVGAFEGSMAKLQASGAHRLPGSMLRYYLVDVPRLLVESLPVAYGAINYPLWEHFTLTRRAMRGIAASAMLSLLLRARWRTVARLPLAVLAAGFALVFATYLFPGYRYRWLQVRFFFNQLPFLSLVVAAGLFTLWDLPRRLGLRLPDPLLVALAYTALLALNVLVLADGVLAHLYRHVGAAG